MLDVKFLRDNLEAVEARLATRGKGVDLSSFKALDEKRRALIKETEALKEKKNKVSEEVSCLKKEGKDAQAIISEMQDVSARIKALDKEVVCADEELKKILLGTPNLPHASVPVGKDENDNAVVRVIGEKPSFSFKPKEHTDIGESLGLVASASAG